MTGERGEYVTAWHRKLSKGGASHVRFDNKPTEVRVVLSGEIDMQCRPRFAEVLGEIRAGPLRDVTVDMAGVSFVSSEGLGFLVSLHEQSIEIGGALTVLDPPRLVIRALELTGLKDLFTIARTSQP